MGILDYAYLSIIVVFVTLGLFNIWIFANKRRDESIMDYLEGKEQRMSKYQK